MTTTTIRLALAAVAVTGVVLLTGCGTATPGAGCDPHGMPGINGCRSASTTTTPSSPTATNSTTGADCPDDPNFPDWLKPAFAADTARRDATPGQTWAVTDECGNVVASDPHTKADTEAWNKQFDQALRQGPPPVDGTVVATHRDGFAECVVDVDQTNGDHSRFTESSCPPVGSHYHRKGGW